MIYIDTSVFLAELLREKRRPQASFWTGALTSSRLLEYEVIVRLHALHRPQKAIRTAQGLLAMVQFAEIERPTLARALQPFPVSVRTLDAIHLSTMAFLKVRGITLELASYDGRLNRAATAIGIPLAPL